MGETRIHIALSDKNRKQRIETQLPVIFFAGPIRNAPKWHDDAIELLVQRNDKLFAALPVRSVRADLAPHIISDDPTTEEFPRQRAWEQYYLYEAARSGCIIFWLPKESAIKEHEGKVYAHITMMELGQWTVRAKHNPDIKIVIGTDGEFPEWSTISYELGTEIPHVPICYSLEETIATAVKLLPSNVTTQ